MAALPPFLLVFDLSALSGSSGREWQEFLRVGECFVPRAVLEEIQFLGDLGAESTSPQERAAREFSRFFPVSGWKATKSIATHPSLQPAEGHAMSKKARLALTVAQTAYGLARNRPDGLVILVANDQGLMQRVRGLGITNLCTIPLVALVQWSRTGRKPPVISHQLQAFRTPVAVAAPATTSQPAKSSPIARRPQQPTVPQRKPVRRSTRAPFRIPLTKIFFNLLTMGMVAIAALAIWRVTHQPSFNNFWQRLPLVNQTPHRVNQAPKSVKPAKSVKPVKSVKQIERVAPKKTEPPKQSKP